MWQNAQGREMWETFIMQSNLQKCRKRKLVSLPFPWKADINNEKEKKKICVCECFHECIDSVGFSPN